MARVSTRALVGLGAAAAIALGTAVPAIAASSADAVQNLAAFKSDCNDDVAGRTFGSWQTTPIKRGAGGTAVYGYLVVGTYDTGYSKTMCVGVVPAGRTAGKGHELSVTALRADANPDIAAAASGKTNRVRYIKTTPVELDGEDDDPTDPTSSDVVVAVATVTRYDMPTFAEASVRLLL